MRLNTSYETKTYKLQHLICKNQVIYERIVSKQFKTYWRITMPMKFWNDKNRKEHTFAIGELMYIENGNELIENLLDEIWNGPHPIIHWISNTMYEVD